MRENIVCVWWGGGGEGLRDRNRERERGREMGRNPDGKRLTERDTGQESKLGRGTVRI